MWFKHIISITFSSLVKTQLLLFSTFLGVTLISCHTAELCVFSDKELVYKLNRTCITFLKIVSTLTFFFQILTNSFKIPENVTTAGSKCYNDNSTLKLNFGAGHSWSINFIKNEKSYQAGLITFTYNLSDTNYFPDASSNSNSFFHNLILK